MIENLFSISHWRSASADCSDRLRSNVENIAPVESPIHASSAAQRVPHFLNSVANGAARAGAGPLNPMPLIIDIVERVALVWAGVT